MRFNNFLFGFIVASGIAACIATSALQLGWFVTDDEAGRKSMAILAYATIVHERKGYQGEVDGNGCYVFPDDERDRIQELVYDFALTSDDLFYSVDSLLCEGFIIPADL